MPLIKLIFTLSFLLAAMYFVLNQNYSQSVEKNEQALDKYRHNVYQSWIKLHGDKIPYDDWKILYENKALGC